MGAAAYNRGTQAISDQIDIQIHGRVMRYTKPASKPVERSLPEGVLRSGYCPDNCLAGTALYLEYKAGWYTVGTRWQILKRRRSLAAAVKMFEAVQMYGLAGLEAAR